MSNAGSNAKQLQYLSVCFWCNQRDPPYIVPLDNVNSSLFTPSGTEYFFLCSRQVSLLNSLRLGYVMSIFSESLLSARNGFLKTISLVFWILWYNTSAFRIVFQFIASDVFYVSTTNNGSDSNFSKILWGFLYIFYWIFGLAIPRAEPRACLLKGHIDANLTLLSTRNNSNH